MITVLFVGIIGMFLLIAWLHDGRGASLPRVVQRGSQMLAFAALIGLFAVGLVLA